MKYLSGAPQRALANLLCYFFTYSTGLGLILSAAGPALAQTTYYVAANGNDNNDGRSSGSPFQSLGKVNSLQLQAGDQVLFRRGDTFRGTLSIRRSGSSGQPIIFDAYGSGNKPIIAGSVPVTGWSNIGGGVWQATCSACGNRVTDLYRGNNALPLGRYPNYSDANRGYLSIQSHQGGSQITSQQGIGINLNTGWNGAEVVIRATQWVMDRYGFNGQSGNSLNLINPNSGYGIQDNWGFFVQNHPATLDQPGEWAFDTNNKTFRLFSSQGNPNDQNITATVHDKAVELTNVSNVTLRNLRISESLNVGLFVNNGSNLNFNGIEVTESGVDGIILTGSGGNVTVENSVVRHTNNTAVRIDPYQNITFRGNTVRRSGTQPGRGRGGDGNYNALQTAANQNVLIENNVIDSVGFNGITYTTNTTIRRNVISNYCMTKSDGGGIYTWNGNRNNVGNIYIQNNIVFNGLGAPEGTPGGAYSGANGIFFDDCTQNAEVSGNTLFNNHGLGLYLRAASNININNNTLFNNGEGQLQLAYNNGSCPTRSHSIQNNILVSRLAGQFVAKYESNANDLREYGNFDHNYYVRPFEDVFKIRAVYHNGSGITGADLSLAQWQSQFGKDLNSKNSPITYPTYTLTPTGNVLLNTAFGGSTDGWGSGYSNHGNGRVEWEASGRLDGGSLRASFPSASNQSNSYMLVTKDINPVTAGKTYQVTFDAVASGSEKRVEVYLRQKTGSYRDLVPRSVILVGTNRQRYTLGFTATAGESSAIMVLQVFEDGKTVWFDNVRLEEATASTNNPDDFIKFVYNPTGQNQSYGLSDNYLDAKGQAYSGSVTLAPYTSLVLLKNTNNTTPNPPPTPVTLRDPENPANAVAGLDYRYYEGNWSQLPDFANMTPVKTGTAEVPDISVRNQDNFFGLRFTGYVNVPTDGTYTFFTNSDDGSKLFIGSTEVVNNDGGHPLQERSGTIGLKAGRHAITVVYYEGAGGEGLSVSYSGPNLSKQVIPASAFFRVGSSGGSGTGLRAEYFNNRNLAGNPALTRTDASVDFDWGDGSPAGSLATDNFSARWTGQVEAPATGSYVFSTASDDGVRLWVNGVQLINNWTDHPPTSDNGAAINLNAGQRYEIRMEYYENGGGAVARLRWSYPGQSQQAIPQGRLYPASGSGRVSAEPAENARPDVEAVVVYPMPAREELSVRYWAEAAGTVAIGLVNPLGQSVLSSEQRVERGENVLKLPVGQYNRGLYLLTLTQGGQRLSHKVILAE